MFKKLYIFSALFFIISIFSVSFASAQALPPPPTSDTTLAATKLKWEQNMVSEGTRHCAALAANKNNADINVALGSTYYDSTRVYYQIADYTKDPKWNTCATDASYVYGQRYVIPNNGGVPGYWNFSTGLRMDFERTGNAKSKQAALLLSTNAAYSNNADPNGYVANFGAMREIAYAVLGHQNAETLGAVPKSSHAVYVGYLLRYMSDKLDKTKWGTIQWSPFMVGLGAEALIREWERTNDTRVLPALKAIADFMWPEAYYASTKSMLYQINPAEVGGKSTTGAPDLNLLITPMYAWLYSQTGDTKYRDMADELYVGGVNGAWIVGGPDKQYNQNYRWAFDYMKWRFGTISNPTTPDTQAPSTPASLSASAVSSSQINLSWVASTDDVSVAGYKIYGGGSQIATTQSTSYQNTGLSAGTAYTYTVAAYDFSGNTSPQSSSVSATTLASGATLDTSHPSTPTGLLASSVSSSQINLSWTASTDNVGVTGYKIYRGGTQVNTANITSYQDTALAPSTAYSYTVSSYDAAGNTSPQSSSVSATTQAVTIANKFTIGDRVQTAAKLNVRATPNGKRLGSQPKGVLGTVIGGPQQVNSYTWYKIDYDSGIDGWSAQDYLALVAVAESESLDRVQDPAFSASPLTALILDSIRKQIEELIGLVAMLKVQLNALVR